MFGFAQKATLPCTEDSSASFRRASSAPYTRFPQNPTHHEIHSQPLLCESERLGLAVLVGAVVQISWGLPAHQPSLLPLGVLGNCFLY